MVSVVLFGLGIVRKAVGIKKHTPVSEERVFFGSVPNEINRQVLKEYYFPFRNIRVSGDRRPFMISALKSTGKDDCLLMPVVTFRMKNDHGRDVLGSHACIRCHGYIERKPVFDYQPFRMGGTMCELRETLQAAQQSLRKVPIR